MVERLATSLPPTATAQAALLRMAASWRALGKINQAIDAYAQIIARYPKSAASLEAADKLQELAQDFERQGHYRLALGLYDKLERFA